MNIGDKIRYLRIKNEMTQKELAVKAEVGQSTLSEYEKNIKNVSVKMIDKFADIFGVDNTYFLTDSYDENFNNQNIKNEMFVSDILDYLIDKGEITDPDNIDKQTLDMIISAIKKDIANKIKKQL